MLFSLVPPTGPTKNNTETLLLNNFRQRFAAKGNLQPSRAKASIRRDDITPFAQ